jgi:hypothetical protein
LGNAKLGNDLVVPVGHCLPYYLHKIVNGFLVFNVAHLIKFAVFSSLFAALAGLLTANR